MPSRPRPFGRPQAAAALAAVLTTALTLSVGGAPAGPASAAGGPDWRACAAGQSDRQQVFARASRISGVPEAVLLGVSYMESRWDAHGSSPSTSGGFGPMHLTHLVSVPHPDLDLAAKGDGTRVAAPRVPQAVAPSGPQFHTLDLAARLTGLGASRIRSDAVANVCAGAALLASYQRRAGGAHRLGDWSAAVARYSTAPDVPTALQFVRQVFTVIRHGAARTTNDGQRVVVTSHPSARPSLARVRQLPLARGSAAAAGPVDCPPTLACESVPAPYVQYGSTPSDYGNHDIADRPNDMKIDFIVIHDTEGSYDTAMSLIQDPTYVSWNYTVRSSDGHVADHVPNQDVAYHAGNWYVNIHSIGVEHEGYAAQGATWYTEALYEDSAMLVRYLAQEYGVPLDRAHIIGHDQVPGITPAYVAGMHWDPGPFWDWQHYMSLLGAPITGDPSGASNIVSVAPGFSTNPQTVTGCDAKHPKKACPTQGTNFVYLHTQPSASSPLVNDIGLRPDGTPDTTDVADIGARAAAGQKLVVAQRKGNWLGVWWLGNIAWLSDPPGKPTVVPGSGQVVVPAGTTPVPVYGRAYPEQSAYPAGIPYQTVTPLQYTIKPGQAFVLADPAVETDYYYATQYNCVGANQCTEVTGTDPYYEIWFGHRVAFVRAADVTVQAPGPAGQHLPLIRRGR